MSSEGPTAPVSLDVLLQHREWVRALARTLTSDPDRADDVEQETWRMAIERPPRHAGSLRAWFGKVVRNAARKSGGRETRRAEVEEAAPLRRPVPSPADLVAEADVQHRLVQAVLELDEPYRSTVLYRFFEGLPPAEIAARLGVPVETVRTRLKRAVERLRERLEVELGDDREAWALLLLGRKPEPGTSVRPAAEVGTAAAAAGGMFMASTTAKAAIAAALLVVAAGALWFALSDYGGAARAGGNAIRAETQAETAGEAHRRAQAPVAAIAKPEEPPVVTPVLAGPALGGIVLDPDGKPVAGARVFSHPDELSKPVTLTQAGGEGSRTFIATTDASGRFRVPVDPKGVMHVLTVATDAGFGHAEAPPSAGPVEIRMIRWQTLSGRVTNTAKEPVAGAKVTLRLMLDALLDERVATSGADGSYLIERVPPTGWSWGEPSIARGRHGYVFAEAPGYAPLCVARDGQGTRPGVTELNLVLTRGTTLTGKVLDAESKAPIAGAKVVVWSVEGMQGFGSTSGASLSNPWAPRLLAESLTAEDGTYRFTALPSNGPSGTASHNGGKRGTVMGHVAAWKEGWAFGGDEVSVENEGAELDVAIELWPSATVTGRVVDAAGAPLADIKVYASVDGRRDWLNGVYSKFPEYSEWVRPTGADGAYRISCVRASRAGPTQATVMTGISRGGGYLSVRASVDVVAGASVAAPDLVVDEGALPRARLAFVDAAGAPVPGAVLDIEMRPSRAGLDGTLLWSSNIYSPDGKAPAPPKPQSAIARAPGYATQLVTFTPQTGAPAEVCVVMQPGARVAGRVRHADGRAGNGATILVLDGTTPPGEAMQKQMYELNRDAHGGKRLDMFGTSTARADGTFVVTDLPAGPYHVAAYVPARSYVAGGPPPKLLRTVVEGVQTGAAEVELTLPADDSPPTQALEMRVTDASGARIDGAYAQATAFGRAPLWTSRATTSAPLRFPQLVAGRWKITVRAAGFVASVHEVEVTAAAPPSALEVQLDRGATLRGLVRGPAGPLAAGTKISLLPLAAAQDASDWSSADVTKDGTFEVAGLVPGRYRAQAAEPGSESTGGALVGSLVIPEGRSDVAADLALVRSGSLMVGFEQTRLPSAPFSGEASDETKDRFGAASSLEVRDAGGILVAAQRGLYARFPPQFALAPGDYVLRLQLGPDEPRTERVTVKAGESATTTFAPR